MSLADQIQDGEEKYLGDALSFTSERQRLLFMSSGWCLAGRYDMWATLGAAKPLASVLEIKRLMKGAQSLEVVQRMADENASFVHMLGQPAAKEAIKAFMEKRKPDFSGL